MDAVEHATVRGPGDWRFVVHPNDLPGATPATRKLAFAAEWRGREDLAAIRERTIGRGFKVLHWGRRLSPRRRRSRS
jgi:hypothetical protein